MASYCDAAGVCMDPLLSTLDDVQRDAVLSDTATIACRAGAGAGKTRVLTRRIARLLRDGCPGQKILGVTFTRDAAEEVRRRVAELADGSPEIRTFHGWCAALLRRHAWKVRRTRWYSIYDETDVDDVRAAAAIDVGGVKAARRSPERWRDAYEERMDESNALSYDDLERLAVTLLRSDPAVLADARRYRHIVVDEYQDVNDAQAEILALLAGGGACQTCFLVGDARQAIYAFRGSNPAHLAQIVGRDGTEVIDLVTNWRSSPTVVDTANHISEQSPTIYGPPMLSAREEVVDRPLRVIQDVVPWALELLERRPADEIAILGRTWSALRAVQTSLTAAGIPTCSWSRRDDADPWSSEEARRIAGALLLAANRDDAHHAALLAEWGNAEPRTPRVDVRAARVVARRQRIGLLEAMADASPAWAAVRQLYPIDPSTSAALVAAMFLEALDVPRCNAALGLVSRNAQADAVLAELGTMTLGDFADWWCERGVAARARSGAGAGVQLLTVHAAKGLEWPAVAVLDVVHGVYPGHRALHLDDGGAAVEEDRRVLYVACTRARDELALVVPLSITTYGRDVQRIAPTPFLPALFHPGSPNG